MSPSSLVDVLFEDEDVEDVGALRGEQLPEWLKFPTLSGWRQVDLSDTPTVPLARMVVHGPHNEGGWAASETVTVFGYTGWPVFGEVLRHAGDALRSLGAVDLNTRVLAVPPVQWVAAVRSSGTARIGHRRVWAQQSNYIAGSDDRHAGRLIVHSIFVDDSYRAELFPDVTTMSNRVYDGFVTSIRG